MTNKEYLYRDIQKYREKMKDVEERLTKLLNGFFDVIVCNEVTGESYDFSLHSKPIYEGLDKDGRHYKNKEIWDGLIAWHSDEIKRLELKIELLEMQLIKELTAQNGEVKKNDDVSNG